MVEKKTPEIAKKRLIRTATCCALAGFLLIPAQPAQAQQITFDPTMYATQLLQKIQTGWAAATNSLGQLLNTQVSTMNTDSINANSRTNIDVKTYQEIGLRYAAPTGYSACAISQGARARAELRAANGAVHQALSTGGANPVDNPVTNAQYIKSRQQGFAPCTPRSSGSSTSGAPTTDTEATFDQAVQCTDPFNGQFQRLDTVMASLISDATYQLPVPTDFILPKNGVAQPIQVETNAQYMPFMAAYSYCQNLATVVPPALQVGSNNQLPVDATAMGKYVREESVASTVYDTCTGLLAERMQYGAGGNQAFNDLHQNQITQCSSDFKRGIIDQQANTDCNANGRSELQALYDWANRPQATSYHNTYVNLSDFDTAQTAADIVAANASMVDFKKLIKDERKELIQAIETSRSAQLPSFSAMAQPISTSP